MEIVSKKDLTPKQALHFLKKTKADSQIEECDADIAKNLSIIYNQFSSHLADIIDSRIEVKNVAPIPEAIVVAEGTKRKRRKSKETEE